MCYNKAFGRRIMDVKKLLHPETLPLKEILEILESLCVKVPSDITRINAVEIFKKVAMPLPQRSRGSNSGAGKCAVESFCEHKELATSNSYKDDENVTGNGAKKMRLDCSSFNGAKDEHGVKFQLNSQTVEPTSLPSTVMVNGASSSCRKVLLKRAHVFQRASICNYAVRMGLHGLWPLKFHDLLTPRAPNEYD